MDKVARRDAKQRRKLWIEMIHQLRFGSPTTPHIEPGECQTFLDFLVEREWPFESPAPKPRFWNHKLTREKIKVETLFNLLPDWLTKLREPKSLDGFPIFYRANNTLFYIDGRRRLSHMHNQNPNALTNVWVLEIDNQPIDPFKMKEKK